MTLGDRCDEIVRLIDETLGSLTTPVPARRRRRVETTGMPGTGAAALLVEVGRPGTTDAGPTAT